MKQPHLVLSPTLRQEIDKLKAETAELNSKTPNSPTKSIALIDRYTNQITHWISSMTAIQRQRTYTLEEIIVLAGLKGYFRYRASNQFAGEALRRCGFRSKRMWSNLGRNKRYWTLMDEKSKND